MFSGQQTLCSMDHNFLLCFFCTTRSVSGDTSDINLCILRSENSALASHTKLHASFSKQTVCNLHTALINKPNNLIRARFALAPKYYPSVSAKTVTLLPALIFIVGKCNSVHFQHIVYQGFSL